MASNTAIPFDPNPGSIMRTFFHSVIRHAAVAAAMLFAGPVAAQVIQHCVVVTTCRTVESEIFGWVYDTI
jgi:hypothetical protein